MLLGPGRAMGSQELWGQVGQWGLRVAVGLKVVLWGLRGAVGLWGLSRGEGRGAGGTGWCCGARWDYRASEGLWGSRWGLRGAVRPRWGYGTQAGVRGEGLGGTGWCCGAMGPERGCRARWGSGICEGLWGLKGAMGHRWGCGGQAGVRGEGLGDSGWCYGARWDYRTSEGLWLWGQVGLWGLRGGVG